MERPYFIQKIDSVFRTHGVAAILGPRQCGKTTLAKMYLEVHQETSVHYFDLEDPSDLAILENPKTVLESLRGLIVIDEIQRIPELFSIIRVLVDQHVDRRFLILGSASRELIRQSSQSLAGRIGYIELSPFSLFEGCDQRQLWVRGGFPPSYLAKTIDDSLFWRKEYIKTFLEQDIPNLGLRIPPQTLRRFWMMLAHYHGQTFNASEIGGSLGFADTTVRHYLDILTGTFMVRSLQPWIEDIKKRQKKRPKIYFRDSGILHTLLGVTDEHSLLHNPKLGASWEGFALEAIIQKYHADTEECFFWSVHGRAELDLLIVKNGRRLGFECKYSDSPSVTKSMQMAAEVLQLDQLIVIYPGDKRYAVGGNMLISGLEREITAMI